MKASNFWTNKTFQKMSILVLVSIFPSKAISLDYNSKFREEYIQCIAAIAIVWKAHDLAGDSKAHLYKKKYEEMHSRIIKEDFFKKNNSNELIQKYIDTYSSLPEENAREIAYFANKCMRYE